MREDACWSSHGRRPVFAKFIADEAALEAGDRRAGLVRSDHFFRCETPELVSPSRSFERVASLAEQIRDVDGGQRVRAFPPEPHPISSRSTPCGARSAAGAFQPPQIDDLLGHLIPMSFRSRIAPD